MGKNSHELRDPIHIFAYFDSDERSVINSRPFQRLRSIHQLALTYLVYPGATHKRFEHSIGVMELADRVFSVVTNPNNIHPKVTDIIPQGVDKLTYWRKVLRMAALCHDLGHLPFSHAAEKELLPSGWNHERLTVEMLRSPEMRDIFGNMTPPLNVEHVVKISVGEKELSKFEQVTYTPWETILAEIITGNAFGVDRMDYLLRDSHHSGVAYGKFDHYRLVDTLRILPVHNDEEDLDEPMLGVEVGGVHSAEALLLARYFMFTQLYFHSVRRIYDQHLKDFLLAWLPDGKYSTHIEDHLAMTDNEVTAGISATSRQAGHAAHDIALRIMTRQHFKVLYERNPDDLDKNANAVRAVYDAACQEFGELLVRCDDPPPSATQSPNFPILMSDDRISWSLQESQILKDKLPPITVGRVYVAPEIRDKARRWCDGHLAEILAKSGEE